jgi:hypothetical protein
MLGAKESTIVRVKTKKISVGRVEGGEWECRICLSEEEEGNRLISPCNCTGSVKYMHTKCFHTWIYKKYEDPLQREQVLSTEGLKCEICHQRYLYSYEHIRKCCNCQVFKRKVALRKFLAFATVLFVLIDLVLLTLMGSYALNDQKDPQFDIRQPRFFLVYIALTFALCSAVYGISEFAKIFLVYQTFELTPLSKEEHPRIKIVKARSQESSNLESVMQESHMRMGTSGPVLQDV